MSCVFISCKFMLKAQMFSQQQITVFDYIVSIYLASCLIKKFYADPFYHMNQAMRNSAFFHMRKQRHSSAAK